MRRRQQQRTEGKPQPPPGCSSSSQSTRRVANGMMTTIVAATAALFCLLPTLPVASAFAPIATTTSSSSSPHTRSNTCLFSSDWSDFSYIDDDDDLLDGDDSMKAIDFADENDPQELKAQVGSSLDAPEVEWDGDPIEVPLGEFRFWVIGG